MALRTGAEMGVAWQRDGEDGRGTVAMGMTRAEATIRSLTAERMSASA
jgi:hypothetical protein